MVDMSKFERGLQHAQVEVETPRKIVVDFTFPKEDVNPIDFTLGDTVNRDNWNDFLIKSFALSRGNQTVQVAFFAWAEQQTGLDVRGTFDSFSQQGGWMGALTRAEKDTFVAAHNAVNNHLQVLEKKHKDAYQNITPRQVELDIEEEVYKISTMYLRNDFDNMMQEMEGVETKEDCKRKLNDILLEIKRKKGLV